MVNMNILHEISDEELLARVTAAAARERAATTELIALLMELDARRLYLAQGYSSLYAYCTQALLLTEYAAYARIDAARAARAFPTILDRLESGELNLTTVGLLKPHLTPDNHVTVLDAAARKSKYEVQKLVATLDPGPGEPEGYRIQLTLGHETYGKLRRVQDLLRHRVPNGDIATIFDKAITLLLRETLKVKAGLTKRPRASHRTVSSSRRVPAHVRRAVWKRDRGRCAFVGPHGRCTETGFLEFHHVSGVAQGGKSTVKNIELRCRSHNVYEAVKVFGKERMAKVMAVRRRPAPAIKARRGRGGPPAKSGRSR